MANKGHKDLINTDIHQPFNTGLDAAKAASPIAGDYYYATDTYKLYRCIVAGAWKYEYLGTADITPATFSTQSDVTALRSLNGTVYQNTSNRTMMITVSVNSTGSEITKFLSDANSTPTLVVGEIYSGATGTFPITFMVLPGNYYKARIDNGSPSIVEWLEWY